MNAITEFSGEFAFLSNFYPVLVEYGGLTYQNSKAAFQATKCYIGTDYNETVEMRKKFCNLTPGKAKRLGRQVRLRDDWEDVKELVMYEVCYHKFTQNQALRQMLLDTGDAELVEGNTWGDRTWGVCGGVGENKLGKILMRLRKELREDAQ